jgi:hypothetical protein
MTVQQKRAIPRLKEDVWQSNIKEMLFGNSETNQ